MGRGSEMKKIVCNVVAASIAFAGIAGSAAAQEAECAEVYTEGVGWTNTFGYGRCEDSEEDLGRLAAGVLVGLGVLWVLRDDEDPYSSLGWQLEEPRNAVVGMPLEFDNLKGSVKGFSITPVSQSQASFGGQHATPAGYQLNLIEFNLND